MTTVSVQEPAGQDRKAPGRPRNAQVDHAIIQAVFDLLGSGQSADSLSMEAVAAKAGVGKATIYRRWANKEALLVDAVAAMKGPLPELAGESVRDDLVMLISAMRNKRMEHYGKVTACLLPEIARSPEMRRIHQSVMEPRREVLRGVLRRGIASGELRADLDVELTLLMLSGPSFAQNVMQWSTRVAADTFAEDLVDAVLRGRRGVTVHPRRRPRGRRPAGRRRPPHPGACARAPWTGWPAPRCTSKAENFQRVGAFKFRGAFNAVSRLDPRRRARGVTAYSSGNHAQAVALAAREFRRHRGHPDAGRHPGVQAGGDGRVRAPRSSTYDRYTPATGSRSAPRWRPSGGWR
ncbi:TetR/AcrR family transcriptional regulator [Actinoplanes nipponensis]|uniref:TetR/AcrR family transcriptional regulator n=1 Tax=Actinoplanes nipponensis TaxID=135950 RepID=UPI0031EAB9C6